MINKYPTNDPNGKTGEEFLESIADSLRNLPSIKYLAGEVSKLKKASKFATASTQNEYGTGGFVTPPPPNSTTSNKVSFFASDMNWYSDIKGAILLDVIPESEADADIGKYYLLSTDNSINNASSIDTAYKRNNTFMQLLHVNNASDYYEPTLSAEGILQKLNDHDLGLYTKDGQLTRFNIGDESFYSELKVGDYAALVSDRFNNTSHPTTALVMGNLNFNSGSLYKPYVAKVFDNKFTLYKADTGMEFGAMNIDYDASINNKLQWYLKPATSYMVGMISKSSMAFEYDGNETLYKMPKISDAAYSETWKLFNRITSDYEPTMRSKMILNHDCLKLLSYRGSIDGFDHNTISELEISHSDRYHDNYFNLSTLASSTDGGGFRIGVFETDYFNNNNGIPPHDDSEYYPNIILRNQLKLSSDTLTSSAPIETNGTYLKVAAIHNEPDEPTTMHKWGYSDWSTQKSSITSTTMPYVEFDGPYNSTDPIMSQLPHDRVFEKVRDRQTRMSIGVHNASIKSDKYVQLFNIYSYINGNARTIFSIQRTYDENSWETPSTLNANTVTYLNSYLNLNTYDITNANNISANNEITSPKVRSTDTITANMVRFVNGGNMIFSTDPTTNPYVTHINSVHVRATSTKLGDFDSKYVYLTETQGGYIYEPVNNYDFCAESHLNTGNVYVGFGKYIKGGKDRIKFDEMASIVPSMGSKRQARFKINGDIVVQGYIEDGHGHVGQAGGNIYYDGNPNIPTDTKGTGPYYVRPVIVANKTNKTTIENGISSASGMVVMYF
jgi:hypothetical protein